MNRVMLASLFPPGVIVEVARHDDEEVAALHPAERALTSDMAPARMREFAAGRNVARRALAALDVPPGPLLPIPGTRMPRWPDGIVGSISHTHGLCAVAVARRGFVANGRAVLALGLDVEGAEPLDEPLVPEICRPDELAALGGVAGPSCGWPKLIFVAKEAAYKAWAPTSGRTLGFLGMRLEIEAEQDGFEATVLGTSTGAPVRLSGRFAIAGGYVGAGVVLM